MFFASDNGAPCPPNATAKLSPATSLSASAAPLAAVAFLPFSWSVVSSLRPDPNASMVTCGAPLRERWSALALSGKVGTKS